MNVEELLRESGNQWRAPDVDEPDLATAIGRSSRRNRIARTAVALVAVLAVGGTAWAALPPRRDAPSIPAVPAPAATEPTATSTVGAPTKPVAPTDQQLVDVARTLRSDFTSPPTDLSKTMEVVQSTVAEVTAASVIVAPAGTDPATTVWVMQLRGSFRCDWCSHPRGKVATQPVLRALVRADLEVIAANTFEEAADLGTIGRVSTATLTARPIGVDEEILRNSLRKNLAALESATLTHDIAYLTTAWRAQDVLGAASSPRSYRSVWLVRLEGSFTCSTCIREQRSTHGSFLAMVIDARSGDLDSIVMWSEPFDDAAIHAAATVSWDPSVLR